MFVYFESIGTRFCCYLEVACVVLLKPTVYSILTLVSLVKANISSTFGNWWLRLLDLFKNIFFN